MEVFSFSSAQLMKMAALFFKQQMCNIGDLLHIGKITPYIVILFFDKSFHLRQAMIHA